METKEDRTCGVRSFFIVVILPSPSLRFDQWRGSPAQSVQNPIHPHSFENDEAHG